MKKRAWLICIAFVLAVIAAPPAPAAEKNYDVELIVFRNVEPGTDDQAAPGNGNIFEDTRPERDDTRRDRPPGAEFERLAATDMRLQTIARRLQNSRLYEPVLHIAWRQPGFSPGRAVAFEVAGGEGDSHVDGKVTLALERYLHLNIDLGFSYRGASFTLRERRRMRSSETHYFDHPRFGVIARITPAD